MCAWMVWVFGCLTNASASIHLYLKTRQTSRSSTLKLSVLSAIHHATDFLHVPPLSQILIYTDNNNTVANFNTLRCLPQYNPILIDAADISIASGIHLRVLHIPGDLNYVADVISCEKFSLAQQYVPGIAISSFLSPQLLPLGAPKK